MAEFKDMLVFYRKRDHLSQRELAKKIGVSASTIGMYECGQRFPEREIEEALADLFNVSLNALRGIDDELDLRKEPDKKQKILLYLLTLLNDDGFEEAVKRIEELTQLEKYKK